MWMLLGMLIGYNMKKTVIKSNDLLLKHAYDSYKRGNTRTVFHKPSGITFAVQLIPLPDPRCVKAD